MKNTWAVSNGSQLVPFRSQGLRPPCLPALASASNLGDFLMNASGLCFADDVISTGGGVGVGGVLKVVVCRVCV